jgi:hypothetical protein
MRSWHENGASAGSPQLQTAHRKKESEVCQGNSRQSAPRTGIDPKSCTVLCATGPKACRDAGLRAATCPTPAHSLQTNMQFSNGLVPSAPNGTKVAIRRVRLTLRSVQENPYGRNPMSRMTPVLMALVLSLAGSALANDGTMLIYDLTELGRSSPASEISERSADHGAPALGATPRMSPMDRTDLAIDWSAGDLELNRRNGRSRPGPSSGLKNSAPQDEPQRNGATPTPEPGTLFLMGSGLAAGARFLRRRKATPA